jgi:predicted aldo/keto reductase-like oxidoreductase
MEPLGELESAEKRPLDKVGAACKRFALILCSACGYRMPCCQRVDIPGNLGAYNDGLVFGKPEAARDRCPQRRDCDGRGAQDIPVGSWMWLLDSALGSGKPLVKRLADVP